MLALHTSLLPQHCPQLSFRLILSYFSCSQNVPYDSPVLWIWQAGTTLLMWTHFLSTECRLACMLQMHWISIGIRQQSDQPTDRLLLHTLLRTHTHTHIHTQKSITCCCLKQSLSKQKCKNVKVISKRRYVDLEPGESVSVCTGAYLFVSVCALALAEHSQGYYCLSHSVPPANVIA